MDNVANQIIEGNKSIIGIMVESNIGAGNQKLSANRDEMQYGVSVTDKCIDWDTTEKTLRDMAEKLRAPLAERIA